MSCDAELAAGLRDARLETEMLRCQLDDQYAVVAQLRQSILGSVARHAEHADSDAPEITIEDDNREDRESTRPTLRPCALGN